MGKRNKEVSVGRRRPMIQLSGGQKQGLSAVSRSNINQEEPKEIPKKHEMDDPLAGFLAEINSLDTPNISETNETTTKALPSNEQDLSQHAYNNMLYDPEHFDPSTQGHLLPEPWQACYDESTMCHYYWNITTNEVQWIPPVATIPPPPPLHSIDKTLEEVKETNDKKKLEEDPAIETDLESNTEPPIKEEKGLERKIEENVMTVDKDEDKPTTENVSSKKEKDKELMNQIKERIQRKKEEKSRKEKQEKQKLEEETLAKSRKEKEDILREKLIKKKLEREKEKSENSKNVDNDELNNSNSNSDSFSVDIFAFEELKVRERRASESKETKNELKKSSRESTPIKDTKSDKSAEVKSGWRLIDAGYDDDDDDDDDDDNDEEDDNDEDEDDNQDSNKKDDIEQKKSNKTDHDENVDNYAEMLLEDAITIDDKISPQDSIPPPPIPPAPLPPSMPPPPPEQDDKPPPPPEEEPMETLEPSAYENDENKKNIDDTSKELFEKLDFLGISTKDLRGLVVCYIELETRMKDWKSGALSSAYLLEKINELSEQITKHEESAAPPGWVCNWSSEFKMYYYYETATGNSQWGYPATSQQQQAQPQQQVVSVSIPTMPTLPAYPTSHVLALQTQQMMMSAVNTGYAGLMMTAALTPPMVAPTAAAMLPSTQPFVATTTVTTTETKKRPASETETSSDPYRDPYRGAAKKKKEVSTFPDQLGERQEISSGTSSPLPGKSIIAAAALIRDQSREASPSLSATASATNLDSDGTFSPIPSKNNTAAETVQSAKAKLKKKKKVDSSGLPSKKKKHVSSLVAKWQTVKQQVDDEENVEEESEDEDFEVQSEKRIQEWKKEVETSGKKNYNPNFQEIKGNWRERLKKKT